MSAGSNFAFNMRFGMVCQMNVGAMVGRMKMYEFALEREMRRVLREMCQDIVAQAISNCEQMIYDQGPSEGYEFTGELLAGHYMRAADANIINQLASGEALSGAAAPSKVVAYVIGNETEYAAPLHDGATLWNGAILPSRPWFQMAVDSLYHQIDRNFIDGTDKVWKGYIQ